MSRELTFLGHPQHGTTLGGSNLTSYRAPGPPTVRGVPAGYQPPAGTVVFRHVGSDPLEPLKDAIVDAVVNGITSVILARYQRTT